MKIEEESISLLTCLLAFLSGCGMANKEIGKEEYTPIYVTYSNTITRTFPPSVTSTVTLTPSPNIVNPEIILWAVVNKNQKSYLVAILENENSFDFIVPDDSTLITLNGTRGYTTQVVAWNLAFAANSKTAVAGEIISPPREMKITDIKVRFLQIEFPGEGSYVPKWKSEVMNDAFSYLGYTNFLVSIENLSKFPCRVGEGIVIAYDEKGEITGFGGTNPAGNIYPQDQIPLPAGSKFGYVASLPTNVYDKSATIEVYPRLIDQSSYCNRSDGEMKDETIQLQIVNSGGGGSMEIFDNLVYWDYGLIVKNPDSRLEAREIDVHMDVYSPLGELVATKDDSFHNSIPPLRTSGLAGKLITFIMKGWDKGYLLNTVIRVSEVKMYENVEVPNPEILKIRRWRTSEIIIEGKIYNSTSNNFTLSGIVGIIYDKDGRIVGGGIVDDFGNGWFSPGDSHDFWVNVYTEDLAEKAELYPEMKLIKKSVLSKTSLNR
jgi:hypothetical protein